MSEEKRKPAMPVQPFQPPPQPPLPTINPLVQQALDQPLTPQDLQYIMSNLPQKIVQSAQQKAQASQTTPDVVLLNNPVYRELMKGFDKVEKMYTEGFTVPYTPPEVLEAQKRKAEEGESVLEMIWNGLNELDPELKEKVTNIGTYLLGMLEKKLGIEGKKGIEEVK